MLCALPNLSSRQRRVRTRTDASKTTVIHRLLMILLRLSGLVWIVVVRRSSGWGCVMSVAMKLIVDAYVSLKNRQALEDLRAHRQRLKRELLLKQTDAFDFSNSIRAFDDEVVVIETGLQRLGGAAAH